MKKSVIFTSLLVICTLFFTQIVQAQVPEQFQRYPQKSVKWQAKQAKHLKNLKERAAASRPSATLRSPEADDKLPTNARFAAQFEENQAIIMTWAYDITFDSLGLPISSRIYGDSTYGTISCNLADAIQANAKVLIRVNSYSDTSQIKQIMSNRGTPLYNYGFYKLAINSWWDRDSGPVCFYYTSQDSIGILDMDYYTYEAVKYGDSTLVTDYNTINVFNRVNDDSIPKILGQKLGYRVFKSSINNEGGNLIFDGLGTTWSSTRTRDQNVGFDYAPIFDPVTGRVTYDSTTKVYENYPVLDDAGYERLFKEAYNSKKFIEPITLDCEGGTGHLDIFCKLFDENRLGLVDYSHAPNHSDFPDWDTNKTAFSTMLDGNGKPLDVRLLPMPLTTGEVPQTECETAPSGLEDQRTYVNGIFVNKAFIMPVLSDPKTGLKPSDVAAVKAFQAALPGYKIVPVEAAIMFGTGGSLHCITHEIPAENPIFIRHTALRGKQPLLNSYEIKADIKNKHGIEDANIYYRKSGQTPWQSRSLSQINELQYTGLLINSGFTVNDTIEYFIEAKSRSGKKITKPFTAREGGYWRFTLTNSVGTKEENAAEKVQIFPNPSTGLFQIQGLNTLEGAVDVSVVTVLGQVVSSQKITGNNAFLDLSNQPAGIYFAKFSGKNLQKTLRLIKK